MDPEFFGSPAVGHFLERTVAPVTKRDDRHLESRVKPVMFEQLLAEPTTSFIRRYRHVPRPLAHLDQHIHVHVLDVLEMSRGDEQILVAVQVHIQKDRRPRPIGGGDPRMPGHLAVGPVAPILEQRVPHELRPVVDQSHRRRLGHLRDLLPFAQPMIPAQHVEHEPIHVAVPIVIGEIHAHRAGAHIAQSELLERPEFALALVDPHPVRCPIVVADVNIRKSVPIQIAESGRQPPIPRGIFEHRTRLIEESAVRPAHRDETTPPIVQQ